MAKRNRSAPEILTLIYESLAFMGGRLDFPALGRMGDTVGSLIWHLVPQRSTIATKAVAQHLGLPENEAKKLAKRSFSMNGRSFMEIMAGSRVDWNFVHNRLRVDDPERLAWLQGLDRPVVYATGHMGAWEVLAGLVSILFPDKKNLVVVRRPRDEALHQLMVKMRTRPGAAISDHRNAVMRILRTLKANGQVAFLVDHNTSQSEAFFLPFLGEVAAVNMGPALMAVRAGAIVQPVVLLREPANRYALTFDNHLDTLELPGERDEKVLETARFYTKALENFIRRWPDQWFWMHRRWKTRPPDEKGGR